MICCRLLVVAVGVLAFSATAGAEDRAIVDCYDAARDHVSRTMAGHCQGVVVSPEEAEDIARRRADRIRRALEPGPPPVAPGKALASIGTGFFVTSAGHVVTNHHVIDGCGVVSVETTTGESVPARHVGSDPANDLALLDSGITAPAAVEFRNPTELEPGARADLVGYPNQGIAPIAPFFTGAVVLRNELGVDEATRFLIEGDVRKGNSGGPILDAGGRVIGVIFAKADTPRIYQETGRIVRDVGVGIPNPVVFRFLDRHGVAYRTTSDGGEISPEAVFAASRPFVARIGCWK